MFGSKFNASKCKTAAGMVTGRVKLLTNKKSLAVRQMKAEIAELQRASRNDNAIIRCEAVMHQEKMIAAFEILQLFCELLSVRLQLIDKAKEIPPDMREAVASIIYAARRVPEVPEVGQLSQQLAIKYGKDFAATASDDATCRNVQVNEKLIDCLSVNPPSGAAKLELLAEIAKEYNVVEWDFELARRQLTPDDDTPVGMMTAAPPSDYVDYTGGGRSQSGGGGGAAVRTGSAAAPAVVAPRPAPAPAVSAPAAVPLASAGGYRDARAAAEAAARYSALAQEASAAATRLAREESGEPEPTSVWPVIADQPPPPQAPRAKTSEEIQRDYDSAMGPPEKKTSGGYPCAPELPPTQATGSGELPAPPSIQPAPLPHPPTNRPFAAPDLPRIPPQGPQPTAPGEVDELDELTKRFEALRKGPK